MMISMIMITIMMITIRIKRNRSHISRDGIYQASSKLSLLRVDVLEDEKMGKCKYLSKFDTIQIVIAR